jgi:hypothetical protein
MSYSSTALRDTYWKRWVLVRDVKDGLKKLEVVGGWLMVYQACKPIKDSLLRFIITLAVRQFCKSAFRLIKDEVRPEYQEAALSGQVMLCRTSLKAVLLPLKGDSGEEYSWIGILQANCTKIRTAKEIVDLLWDLDGGRRKRKRWEHYSYRGFCERALQLVRLHCGAAAADTLYDQIKRVFLVTTWVIPYANNKRFWPTERGHRNCLAPFNKKLHSTWHDGQTILFKVLYGVDAGQKVPQWLEVHVRMES